MSIIQGEGEGMTDYAVCPYCGSSSLTGRCNGYFCLSCMHFIDIDEVTE